MNKDYGKALQYMADDVARAQKAGHQRRMKYEKTAVTSLKEAERAWLSYRDIQCKAAGQQYERGSISPMIYSQCLTTLTEHRIADLKSIFQRSSCALESWAVVQDLIVKADTARFLWELLGDSKSKATTIGENHNMEIFTKSSYIHSVLAILSKWQ